MKRNEMRSRISEIFINCELDAAWFVRSIEKHILAAKRVQSSRRKCQSRNCIVIHRVERMAQWHTSQWRTYHFYVLRKTQENRKTKQNRNPQQKQCTIQKSEMYSLLFFLYGFTFSFIEFPVRVAVLYCIPQFSPGIIRIAAAIIWVDGFGFGYTYTQNENTESRRT